MRPIGDSNLRNASASRGTSHKLSTFELVALCAVLILLSATATAFVIRDDVEYREPLLKQLQETYGPSKESRGFEEWIIRDHFRDRRQGVFLDVGASHYQRESNTFFLEKSLGWSGIAVDALEEFGPDYATHRPRTRYVAMFASDVADSTVQLFVPENTLVSSATEGFAKSQGVRGGMARQVPTTTLNAVLEQANLPKIDFLNMDIELAEPKALAGFDIERFRPDFVCIEGHPQVRQQILDYFHQHGYVVVGKYLRADPLNLYFRPAK